MFVDGLIHFEEIAESKAAESSKGNAEEKKIAKIKKHLLDNLIPYLIELYVISPPASANCRLDIVPKRIIATASFRIPSPKRTALSTGNFSTLIKELAATVSVAHRTLLRTKISESVRA